MMAAVLEGAVLMGVESIGAACAAWRGMLAGYRHRPGPAGCAARELPAPLNGALAPQEASCPRVESRAAWAAESFSGSPPTRHRQTSPFEATRASAWL